jgi:hypothetical protein
MKFKLKTMIITLSIIGLLIIILIAGKINSSNQFSKQVNELFAQSKNISEKTFRQDQLIGLPEPVQRYFKHVLKEGQPYVSYVRLTHDGKFKMGLDKKWTKIKGEQYFTAEKPGYIWKGTTTLATARDMYISDKGRLVVTLLSLINVVDGQGKVFDEGEFQRWVSESVWFPTNLLPSEKLQWIAVDENTAKLIINYNELSVSFLVSFNSKGEITQMETRRFMEKGKKETWICKMGDYKNMNGILIPTTAEALWKLDKGDFSYAKFNVKKIEYNMPEKF